MPRPTRRCCYEPLLLHSYRSTKHCKPDGNFRSASFALHSRLITMKSTLSGCVMQPPRRDHSERIRTDRNSTEQYCGRIKVANPRVISRRNRNGALALFRKSAGRRRDMKARSSGREWDVSGKCLSFPHLLRLRRRCRSTDSKLEMEKRT